MQTDEFDEVLARRQACGERLSSDELDVQRVRAEKRVALQIGRIRLAAEQGRRVVIIGFSSAEYHTRRFPELESLLTRSNVRYVLTGQQHLSKNVLLAQLA